MSWEKVGVTFHVTPAFRYFSTIAVCNLMWWGAFVLVILRTFEVIGARWGLIIILMMGLGINSGLSLSRMKMEKSILAAFETGYRTSERDNKNRNLQ
jgi:hypothetical protein